MEFSFTSKPKSFFRVIRYGYVGGLMLVFAHKCKTYCIMPMQLSFISIVSRIFLIVWSVLQHHVHYLRTERNRCRYQYTIIEKNYQIETFHQPPYYTRTFEISIGTIYTWCLFSFNVLEFQTTSKLKQIEYKSFTGCSFVTLDQSFSFIW